MEFNVKGYFPSMFYSELKQNKTKTNKKNPKLINKAIQGIVQKGFPDNKP